MRDADCRMRDADFGLRNEELLIPHSEFRNPHSLCLCGTPLATDIARGLWVCLHCGRAFCRDCGGMMARVGGCDTCTVCGVGMCG